MHAYEVMYAYEVRFNNAVASDCCDYHTEEEAFAAVMVHWPRAMICYQSEVGNWLIYEDEDQEGPANGTITIVER